MHTRSTKGHGRKGWTSGVEGVGPLLLSKDRQRPKFLRSVEWTGSSTVVISSMLVFVCPSVIVGPSDERHSLLLHHPCVSCFQSHFFIPHGQVKTSGGLRGLLFHDKDETSGTRYSRDSSITIYLWLGQYLTKGYGRGKILFLFSVFRFGLCPVFASYSRCDSL